MIGATEQVRHNYKKNARLQQSGEKTNAQGKDKGRRCQLPQNGTCCMDPARREQRQCCVFVGLLAF